MMMKGDIGLLTVAKIKRYMERVLSLSPFEQRLSFQNRLLADHETAADVGLHDGAVVTLSSISTGPGKREMSPLMTMKQHSPTPAGSPPSSLTYQGVPQQQQRYGNAFDDDGEHGKPSWFLREVQRVREEERTRFDNERRRREADALQIEVERARMEERARLATEQYVSLEQTMRADIDKYRQEARKWEQEAQKLGAKVKQLEEDRVRDAEMFRDERRKDLHVAQQREEERCLVEENMESILRKQTNDLQALQRQVESLQAALHSATTRKPSLEVVHRSLLVLSNDLGLQVPLQLDDSNTTIVAHPEGLNLIITFDPMTERLFLYTTLLNHIPSDPRVRYQVYEELLQGSLLGREMAGGSVGISTNSTNPLILMSTSLDMRHVDEQALRHIARPFLAAAGKWIDVVAGIVHRPLDS